VARGVRAASFGDGDGVGRRRELVVREEAGAVETVVRLERDAVERAHRLRFQVLHLATVARNFAFGRHGAGHFDVVAGRIQHARLHSFNVEVGESDFEGAKIPKISDDTKSDQCILEADQKCDSSLLYNEFIVYDTNRINLKYLCQVDFEGDEKEEESLW